MRTKIEKTNIGEETLSLEKYQKLRLINYAAYALTSQVKEIKITVYSKRL